MRNDESELFKGMTEEQAANMLKGMLIKLCRKDKITFKKFSELHRDYMISTGVTSARKIASDRNNIIRTIVNKDKMTYNMLEHVIRDILKYNLTNISMTVRDKNNVPWLLSMDRATF